LCGGAGGASTAAEAKRNDPSLKVTILQEGKFVFYASCPTPYYIGDLIKDVNKLVARTPGGFSHDGIDVQLNTKVINIDTKAGFVEAKESRRSARRGISFTTQLNP
jgi:NADPH-dependent 2,4-dienoyl-CoA reductase/sulfur reductase-like enzyme